LKSHFTILHLLALLIGPEAPIHQQEVFRLRGQVVPAEELGALTEVGLDLVGDLGLSPLVLGEEQLAL
jgi:hypothetical protein